MNLFVTKPIGHIWFALMLALSCVCNSFAADKVPQSTGGETEQSNEKLNKKDKEELQQKFNAALIDVEKGDAHEQGEAAYFLSEYYRTRDSKKSRDWLSRAAQLANPLAISALGFNKPYVSVTEFKCDEYKIKVSTSCSQVLVDGSVKADCQSQEFEFSKGNQIHKYHLGTHFNWMNPEGNQEDVYTKAEFATCIHSVSKGKAWLLVQSSGSFAGDMQAYRYDIYDGMDYVGSDNHLHRQIWGKGYKEVSRPLLKKLRKMDIANHDNNHQVNESVKIKDYPSINDTINEYRKEK